MHRFRAHGAMVRDGQHMTFQSLVPYHYLRRASRWARSRLAAQRRWDALLTGQWSAYRRDAHAHRALSTAALLAV